MYLIGNSNGEFMEFKMGQSPRYTTDISKAKLFEDEAAARRSMKTIPKAILEMCEWFPIRCTKNEEIVVKETKVVKNENYIRTDLKDLSLKIDNEFAFLNSMMTSESSLEKALDELQAMQQDLLHYIEFNDLNASDGFNSYKLLHNIRVKRREVKDQLATIKMMKSLKVTDLFNGTLKSQIVNIENRVYGVRSNITRPIFEKKISKSVVNSINEELKKVI